MEDAERAAESIDFFRRGVELRRPATREIHLPDRIIEMRLMPMPEGGGIATYLDITAEKSVEADLRRAKEEAELASRSKTEFLANMSHELRTPLNAIIGFADILRGEVFGRLGDKRYVDYAGDIRDSGLHLLKLINDVLDVSKIEFGKIELAEEAVDVAAVVVSCVRLMRERVQAAGLTVTQSLPPDLPLVQADELRLKQILLNLLSNAVKFTAAGRLDHDHRRGRWAWPEPHGCRHRHRHRRAAISRRRCAPSARSTAGSRANTRGRGSACRSPNR